MVEEIIINSENNQRILKPREAITMDANNGATIPLLCQKKFAKPEILPAFFLSIIDTALEFAGVIINLTNPIVQATIKT